MTRWPAQSPSRHRGRSGSDEREVGRVAVSLVITRPSHSRLQGRQVAISGNCDFRVSGLKSVFYRKIDFWNFRSFRTCSSQKNPIKSTFRKKLLEKFILINFQPFPKQIKVLTKFHNFKPPEMKKKNRPPAASPDPPLTPPDLPLTPQSHPKIPPKSARVDPKVTPSRPRKLSSVLWNHDLTG